MRTLKIIAVAAVLGLSAHGPFTRPVLPKYNFGMEKRYVKPIFTYGDIFPKIFADY